MGEGGRRCEKTRSGYQTCCNGMDLMRLELFSCSEEDRQISQGSSFACMIKKGDYEI